MKCNKAGYNHADTGAWAVIPTVIELNLLPNTSHLSNQVYSKIDMVMSDLVREYSSALLYVVFIRYRFQPLHFAVSMYKVGHIAAIIGTVPMFSTRRAPDCVSNSQFLRRTASITNPTASSYASNELTSFVSMPVRSCARRKSDCIRVSEDI